MREWMIRLREAKYLSDGDAAQLCGISRKLLWILEDEDGITHPRIADRIAHLYGMDVEQRNELCDERHALTKLRKPQKPPSGTRTSR